MLIVIACGIGEEKITQIFRTPKGPAIRVGLEERGKGPEHHLILAYNGIVRHRWYSELPDEFELIHDPGARAEAQIAVVEANSLIREKAILIRCLEAAVGMLDERCAKEIRDIYRTESSKMDVISMTKAG